MFPWSNYVTPENRPQHSAVPQQDNMPVHQSRRKEQSQRQEVAYPSISKQAYGTLFGGNEHDGVAPSALHSLGGRRDLSAPTGAYQHNYTDNYAQKDRPPRQLLSNFERFLANTNLHGAEEVVPAARSSRQQHPDRQSGSNMVRSVALPSSAEHDPTRTRNRASLSDFQYSKESPEDSRPGLSDFTNFRRPSSPATDIKRMRASKVVKRLNKSQRSSFSDEPRPSSRVRTKKGTDAVMGPASNSLMGIASEYYDIDGTSYSEYDYGQNMDMSDEEMDQDFEVLDDFEDLPPPRPASPSPPPPPSEVPELSDEDEEYGIDIISPQEAERLYPPRQHKISKKYKWYKDQLEEPHKGSVLEGILQYIPVKENKVLKREVQVEEQKGCHNGYHKTLLTVGQRYVVWLDVSNSKYLCLRKVYREKPEGDIRISYRSFCDGHGIIRLDAKEAFHNCPFENPSAMKYIKEALPNTVPPPHHVSVDASEPSNILIASIQSFRGGGNSSTKKKRSYSGCIAKMVLFPHYVDPQLGEISFPLVTSEEKECFDNTIHEFYFKHSYNMLDVTGLEKVEALTLHRYDKYLKRRI